jgi:NDP-sugar pyrophosphorylase family protein
MQIVIPMSGFGERFRKAGYDTPKPLIEIEGKPIIAHVIDMFPEETDFLFICNQDHLENLDYNMKELIKEYCSTARIVGIKPHKLGPVHAINQIIHMLDYKKPVLVNYCDFTCYWDWRHFKSFVINSGCDGAIPAYHGFHPHSLGTTNYAYIKENDGWAYDIQEKKPFTDNRMAEFASSGTYYFSSVEIMSDAFDEIFQEELDIDGEFYVSLAYKALFRKNYNIAVYPLEHFIQWGTPEDVFEYNTWSKTFKNLINYNNKKFPSNGYVVIPMAGMGQRFINENYKKPKPLIHVSGKSMVVQAANDLPTAHDYIFVLREDMIGYKDILKELKHDFPKSKIVNIDGITDGQATSAYEGMINIEKYEFRKPGIVTIGACDNGAIYNTLRLNKLINNPNVDIIIWGVRGYPNAIRDPEMYGWLDLDNNMVKSISVKKPLSKEHTEPIALGTFTFLDPEMFFQAYEKLIERDGKVKGEFYIDSLINDAISLGFKCHYFEVDNYLCWGTPNDLRTFEYWQSCFHKWSSHPYRLELDTRVDSKNINKLKKLYQRKIPKNLEKIK